MEKNPDRPKTVAFRFSSNSEKSIYQLAACLKENRYTITECRKSDSGDFLCVAETEVVSGSGQLDRMCIDMQIIAERKGVAFDGWEMVIEVLSGEIESLLPGDLVPLSRSTNR